MRRDEYKYHIGQQVVVDAPHARTPSGPHKVESIGKKKLRLDNGTEWNIANSSSWGSSKDPWSRTSIRPATEADLLAIEREKLASFLEQRSLWQRMPIEIMREVRETVSRALKGE